MLVSNEEPSSGLVDAGATQSGSSTTDITPPPGSNSSNTADVIRATRQDSFDSVNSDSHWADKSRVVTLRASSPEVSRVHSYGLVQ